MGKGRRKGRCIVAEFNLVSISLFVCSLIAIKLICYLWMLSTHNRKVGKLLQRSIRRQGHTEKGYTWNLVILSMLCEFIERFWCFNEHSEHSYALDGDRISINWSLQGVFSWLFVIGNQRKTTTLLGELNLRAASGEICWCWDVVIQSASQKVWTWKLIQVNVLLSVTVWLWLIESFLIESYCQMISSNEALR